MGSKTYPRKKFPYAFERPKALELMEKEIEKRLGTDILITIGDFPPDHSHFTDEFKLEKDPKGKYWATLQFTTEKVSLDYYLHTFFHCYRAAMGFPRFTATPGDYGMYIDNCLEHCLIYEQVSQYGTDTMAKHQEMILQLIQPENFPQISEQTLQPIQQLQLAAVATEISYLHAFSPQVKTFMDEFRKYFVKIENMRKDLVKLITTKAPTTPENKFALIAKCWELLGKPTNEFHTYCRLHPKKGLEHIPISQGFKD